MASIGDELVFDILLGNHDIINDVLAREKVDSCYSMISGFLHTYLRSLSREAPSQVSGILSVVNLISK